MKKFLLIFIGSLISIGAFASVGDKFTYEGISYTILSETDKTCKTSDIENGSNVVEGYIVLHSNVPYNGYTYKLIEIGKSTFGCTEANYAIKSITIPNSVRKIGAHAFIHCKGLQYLYFGTSLSEIGEGALGFVDCEVLDCAAVTPPVLDRDCMYGANFGIIYVPEQSVDLYKSTSFNGAYGWASRSSQIKGKSIGLTVQGIVFQIQDNEAIIIGHTDGLQSSLSIPAQVEYEGVMYPVTSIERSAFIGCNGLTSVEIPNSVISIGSSAFSGCSGLTSVEIPNSVTTIGSSAFYGCSGLTSVEIPNSVTSIGDDTFYGCSGLTSLEIPNSVISIGSLQSENKL